MENGKFLLFLQSNALNFDILFDVSYLGFVFKNTASMNLSAFSYFRPSWWHLKRFCFERRWWCLFFKLCFSYLSLNSNETEVRIFLEKYEELKIWKAYSSFVIPRKNVSRVTTHESFQLADKTWGSIETVVYFGQTQQLFHFLRAQCSAPLTKPL